MKRKAFRPTAFGWFVFLTPIILAAVCAVLIASSGGESGGGADKPESITPPKPEVSAISERAVIDALSETPELVGLSGEITKQVTVSADKWYGDKTYSLTLNGTFKLGVSTEDIGVQVEGSSAGSDVILTLPPVQLIALELPFDEAEIAKDVGVLREVSDAELQALYGAGRTQVAEEVMAEDAVEKADKAVRHALADLITEVGGVERVIFANKNEE